MPRKQEPGVIQDGTAAALRALRDLVKLLHAMGISRRAARRVAIVGPPMLCMLLLYALGHAPSLHLLSFASGAAPAPSVARIRARLLESHWHAKD